MTKRILALIFAVVMILSLAACGDNAESADGAEGFVFTGTDAEEKGVSLGEPAATLNPADVYAKLTYTPEMFYGRYRIKGGDEAVDSYAAESAFSTVKIDGEDCNMTVLPVEIEAGKETLMHKVTNIEEYYWARLHFMRRYGDSTEANLDSFLCAYTIEGKKITFKPLDEFSVDDEAGTITYAFSETEFVYDFSFTGRTLTLKSGENSVTLTTGLDAYGVEDYFCVENYLNQDSKYKS